MPGSSRSVTKAELRRLAETFAGEVIAPGATAYDEARRVWNALFDRRPALVLRPTSAADVATAIRFGREKDLEIAIKSGAHSAAGHSSIDDGLVIDMSQMRGVTVDPKARTARVNGGALLGELDIAAQEHGLVCPIGVIGHTGVAGLTLGGGIGRLQRNFGMTIDNLRSVDLVTADGRTVRSSETEEPDLFWGLRGAGANFGVATAFDFNLHEFGPHLHRGLSIYRGSQVREVWSMVRDFGAVAPDAVALIMVITRAEPAEDYPPSVAGEPIVLVAYNHSGDAAAVDRDTALLRAGPEPVSSTTGSQPYLEVQTANDLAMGWGHRAYIMGCYADDLRPAALDAMVDHAADLPIGASFSVTVQGGAMGRVPDEAMAYTGRAARYDLGADTEWEDPAFDARNQTWVERTMAIVEPDSVPGCYVNELSASGPDVTRSVYGDTKLGRLRDLKRAWDPANVFHRNHNIEP